MLRGRVFGAVAAVLSLASLSVRAELPALPGNAIGDDSVAIIQLNPGKLDPASVKASVKAILGGQAGMADEGLNSFQAKYDEIIKAGAQSMTMVFGTPAKKGDEPKGAAYVQMKPGTDPAALQKLIQADMKGPEAEQSVFETSGNFLVMHKKDVALPTKASPEQQKALAAAVSDAGDKAIVIAFAPTEAARAQLTAGLADNKDMPPPAVDAAAALINAKWVSLAVALGDAPALGVTVQAADDASAKKLVEQINGGIKEAQDQAKGNPFGAMVMPLLDALKPVQQGTKITLGIDGKTLAPIAQMVAQFAGASRGQAQPRGPGSGTDQPKHVPAPQ